MDFSFYEDRDKGLTQEFWQDQVMFEVSMAIPVDRVIMTGKHIWSSEKQSGVQTDI